MASQYGPVAVQRLHVSTRDEAEAETFIRQVYAGNRTRFEGAHGDDARFTIDVAEVGGIATDHLRATVDYSAAVDPLDYFFSLVPYRGRFRIRNGREETICLAGEACFYPTGVPFELEVTDLGVRTVRLPLEGVGAVAEETAGIAAAELRFSAITPVSPAAARIWAACVELASGILLEEDSLAAHSIVAAELARTAAVTALHTFPNTALTRAYQPGPGWVTPRLVRRAAAFIEAHADQPLSVQQIAAAAGVSARTLRAAFRRHHDTTPTGYLRRVRLERADAQLRAADPAGGLTVAQVAHQWGWASTSRFAAAYQRRFGIPPSRTLGTEGRRE